MVPNDWEDVYRKTRHFLDKNIVVTSLTRQLPAAPLGKSILRVQVMTIIEWYAYRPARFTAGKPDLARLAI